MAKRPWITPADVRSYTESDGVMKRTDEKLQIDITRAEHWIIENTNNPFTDPKDYSSVPAPVKTAAILLAEFYARAAVERRNLKSETYDDYSYTASDKPLQVAELDLGYLLREFVVEPMPGSVDLRLRKL